MVTDSTERLSGRARVAALVVGDAAALLVFAAIGRRSHGEAAGLGAAFEVARTALPFVVGWFAVAPWAGAFDPARTAGVAPMLRTTLLGWIGGLLLGSVVRAGMVGRVSPWSFYVVTFMAVLLLLGLWRAGFALWEHRRTTN